MALSGQPVEHIDYFLANYGYFAIFFLLMLGIVGPLIPDDTILVLSGLAVHRGQLNLAATIAVAYAGSLCGITLSYMLGRTGAVFVLKRIPPVGRWLDRHLPHVEKWFEQYGKWTLFFGYFLAGVRHFTALAAGMGNVRPRTFALYAYPGGFAWVSCFIAIGYFLGAEWDQLQHRFERGAVVGVAVLAVVGLIAWLLNRRRVASGRNA
jgi:membrane protein DedA with SNARE-associated domain